MTQPCAEVVQPDPPPEDVHTVDPAAWALLIVLLGVLVFEVWALGSGHHTISQWLQHRAKSAWFRWLGVAVMAIATWHFFWGFPWKWR